MSNTPSILIIGAGASGIAAATKLLKNGISNFKILEAEERIGGRVYSTQFGGSMVDIGGQWVHGEKGNIVYEMVKDLNLLSPSINDYEDNTFYLSNGTQIDKELGDQLYDIYNEVHESGKVAEDMNQPYGDYFIKRFNDIINERYKDDISVLKLAKYFEDWCHKMSTCNESSKTWYDLSVQGSVAGFIRSEGNQQLNWRNKGYRTILDVLMEKTPDLTKTLPVEDKILLNKEVNKIVWDGNTLNENKPTVYCSDGSSYTADHILITASVGVLKKFYKSWFVPELPWYKVNCIEHISLGVVNKILIKFPTKWWPDGTKGFNLLWTEKDSLNLRNELPASGPIDEHGKSWLEDVFGFYIIDSQVNTLLGWVVGKMAAEVEYMSDKDVIAVCMFVLRKFLGKIYDICEPDEILRSKWSSNPHFCGSYVYKSIDQEKHNATAEDLARPIIAKSYNKPTLFFAGEATSTDHFSTVHGAIETGFREGDRLVDLLQEA
ncbi:spermine oxidase-like [Diabrotica undecimpunctata]|uniref:spermine oxidase-like n=1 Tax=Diabrotica undecimpunctata TaxID=50387 RepID=UPI003B6374F5